MTDEKDKPSIFKKADKPEPEVATGDQTPKKMADTSIQQDAADPKPDPEPSTEAEDNAKRAEQILVLEEEGPAKVRTSVDTADLEARKGVVGAVDQAPDADTVMVHPKEGLAEFEAENEAIELEESNDVIYVYPGVNRFNMGPYDFQDGRLTLKPDQEGDFLQLLGQQPTLVQNKIQKIDKALADQMVRARIGSTMRSGVDTTANALPLRPGEGV